ncbi:MAG TPA: Hpt domain-containing protein, partial [Bacilli bacterium]
MELNQYLSIFLDESKDHLQALNENLLSLENNPQDIGIVQHIFRSAHTLKGMSATMGFEDMASLTHEMENILDLLRNSKLEMNPFIFDTLFKSLDALETMVLDITNGGTGKADVKHIIGSLNSVVSRDYENKPNLLIKQEIRSPIHLDQYQFSVLQQAIESKHDVFYLEVSVREDCILKAARAYMVFNLLEAHGEVVKSFPSVEDIEREKFDIKFNL